MENGYYITLFGKKNECYVVCMEEYYPQDLAFLVLSIQTRYRFKNDEDNERLETVIHSEIYFDAFFQHDQF